METCRDTRLSSAAKAPSVELTGVTVMVAVVRLPDQPGLGSRTAIAHIANVFKAQTET